MKVIKSYLSNGQDRLRMENNFDDFVLHFMDNKFIKGRTI